MVCTTCTIVAAVTNPFMLLALVCATHTNNPIPNAYNYAGNPDFVTHIGVAFSTDGFTWTRLNGGNPIVVCIQHQHHTSSTVKHLRWCAELSPNAWYTSPVQLHNPKSR